MTGFSHTFLRHSLWVRRLLWENSEDKVALFVWLKGRGDNDVLPNRQLQPRADLPQVDELLWASAGGVRQEEVPLQVDAWLSRKLRGELRVCTHSGNPTKRFLKTVPNKHLLNTCKDGSAIVVKQYLNLRENMSHLTNTWITKNISESKSEELLPRLEPANKTGDEWLEMKQRKPFFFLAIYKKRSTLWGSCCWPRTKQTRWSPCLRPLVASSCGPSAWGQPGSYSLVFRGCPGSAGRS